jgi:hypothetical protein
MTTTLRSIAQSLVKPQPRTHTADFFSGPVFAGHHVTFHLNLEFKTGHETYTLSVVRKGESEPVWKDQYPYRQERSHSSRVFGHPGFNSGFTIKEPGEYEAIVKRLGRIEARFPFTVIEADPSTAPCIRFENDETFTFLNFEQLQKHLGEAPEQAIAFANTLLGTYSHRVCGHLYHPLTGTYTCVNHSFLRQQMDESQDK